MKIANITLALRPGMVIPLTNVTPAEAQFLVAEHQAHAKRNPVVVDEASISEVERSERAEYARLSGKYNPKRIKAMYPAASYRFPTDYEQAFETGLAIEMPSSQFMNEQDKPEPTKGDE